MVHIAAHQGNLDCLKVFAGLENAVEIFKVQDKVNANVHATPDDYVNGFLKDGLDHHIHIYHSLTKEHPLSKEHPPPTFGPISCSGPKFT